MQKLLLLSMKTLDFNTWKRKEHFNFFKDYDEPYFGIVADVDVTKAYHKCKESGFSFFAYYLHKSLAAVNSIEEFKYRIVDDKVVICDMLHSASTIGREDETFAFSFVEYNPDFDLFNKALQLEVEKVRNSTGLGLTEGAMRLDAIHYTSTPWISFTSVTHARNFKSREGNPLIAFGKAVWRDDKFIMPVSVSVHHALMDAVHVAKYFDSFQRLLDTE